MKVLDLGKLTCPTNYKIRAFKKCCLLGHNIISKGLIQAIKNNIMAKKTTELVLFFHKKTTRLVFLWPNMI